MTIFQPVLAIVTTLILLAINLTLFFKSDRLNFDLHEFLIVMAVIIVIITIILLIAHRKHHNKGEIIDGQ